jgi:hypothetical protein
MATDMTELMHECTTADDSEVIHYDFTCQLCRVGHNDVITQDAVVCHMAVCHDQVVVSDDGLTFAERTTMHRNELTQYAVVADDRPSYLAVELEVLRDSSDHSGREYMAMFAQLGVLTDSGIGVDDTTVSDLYVLVNEDERTYFYIRADLGFRMNTC